MVHEEPQHIVLSPDGPDPCAAPEDRWLLDREAGQDLVEYAILSSLIVIVVIGAMTLLGQRLQTMFQGVVSTLPFGGS